MNLFTVKFAASGIDQILLKSIQVSDMYIWKSLSTY